MRQWDKGFREGAICALKIVYGHGEGDSWLYREMVTALGVTADELRREELPVPAKLSAPPAPEATDG